MAKNKFVSKFLEILDNILGTEVSPLKKNSLDYVNRLRWLKFKVLLRGYFIGFFLYPWVWVWGLWLILVSLVVYLVNTDALIFITYHSSLPNPIPGLAKGYGYEWLFLGTLGVIFLFNYTISFFSYRKNPALGMIMCILSLWILLIAYFYLIILWQYNYTFHNR